ncbi:hypothetical protein AMJ80_12245 [bacterium SM23_31]|nr:MAG: hypothetical protein AMJ80_12245 [bacterium SM23_31]
MKKLSIILILSIFCTAFFTYTTFSDQIIAYFKIGFVPIQDKIMLKWKSNNETPVEKYIIERSLDNITFKTIGSEAPKNNNTDYQFIDSNIFKTASRTFYYRLKVQKKDGTFFYTNIVHLSPRISSAKQTWGSIKAIFH